MGLIYTFMMVLTCVSSVLSLYSLLDTFRVDKELHPLAMAVASSNMPATPAITVTFWIVCGLAMRAGRWIALRFVEFKTLPHMMNRHSLFTGLNQESIEQTGCIA